MSKFIYGFMALCFSSNLWAKPTYVFEVGDAWGIVETKNKSLDKLQIIFGCDHEDYKKSFVKKIDPYVEFIEGDGTGFHDKYYIEVPAAKLKIRYPFRELRTCYYQFYVEYRYMRHGKEKSGQGWYPLGAGNKYYIPHTEDIIRLVNDKNITEKIQQRLQTVYRL